MNKEKLVFLGYEIDLGALQDIEEKALSRVQQRANSLYVQERGYTVAKAWVDAVLEYLVIEARNAPSARLNVKRTEEPLNASRPLGNKGGSGGLND